MRVKAARTDENLRNETLISLRLVIWLFQLHSNVGIGLVCLVDADFNHPHALIFFFFNLPCVSISFPLLLGEESSADCSSGLVSSLRAMLLRLGALVKLRGLIGKQYNCLWLGSVLWSGFGDGGFSALPNCSPPQCAFNLQYLWTLYWFVLSW